jgi:hypothetical protein
MKLNVLHRRLMQDVLEVGNSLPLVITGGYAVQAHQLVDRLSRDIDGATNRDIPMEDIAAAVVAGLTARGWDMCIILIDIHAASQLCSNIELESLGRRHAWDEQFSLSELKARLEGAEWYDDQAFAEYGLSAERITNLRRWAQAWADDIVRRIGAETDEEDDNEPF